MSALKKSPNKWAYRYLLTSKGIKEKYRITKTFLQIKLEEYEKLKKEIEELEREIGKDGKK